MKAITYNIVPICFIGLAALMIHYGVGGWGWCIFAAIILTSDPYRANKEEE